MLLRASGEMLGGDPDLRAVNEGAGAARGVRSGAELLAFTDAVLSRDRTAIAATRGVLKDAVDAEGLVDAAAVIGNFERMNRIADAIGIPLETPAAAASLGIQEELELRRFASASHTPDATLGQRVLSVFARPLLRVAGRIMSRRT